MKTLARIALALALLAAAAAPLRAQTTIDAVVASVNNQPLLASDWDDQLRFELLRQGRQPSGASHAERRAAFAHLIERELMRQQMQELYAPTQKEIDQARDSLRQLFPSLDDDGWRMLEQRYGFDEARLNHELATQLQTMRFVEARLTPSVRVERSEIESYYNDVLAPEVKSLGQQPDSLAMVAPRIRQLLTEQKINQLFFRWMAELRSHSDILLFTDDADAQAGLSEPESAGVAAAPDAKTPPTAEDKTHE